MPIPRFPLETNYQIGSTLYDVIRGVQADGSLQYWNTTLNAGAGGWEAFNSAHWAQYAIALTEDANTGYYHAAYPAGIVGVLTSETAYVQAGAGPVLGDAPAASIARSQGQNVGAVAGDANVPSTLQQNLFAVQPGAAAGVPTASVIPTNLTNAQANAFAGRAVVFTSGAAIGCAARIVGYVVLNGVLTLAAPLPVAPAAGDTFVLV